MASATLARSNPAVIPLPARPAGSAHCLKEANGIVSGQTLTSLEQQNGRKSKPIRFPTLSWVFYFPLVRQEGGMLVVLAVAQLVNRGDAVGGISLPVLC